MALWGTLRRTEGGAAPRGGRRCTGTRHPGRPADQGTGPGSVRVRATFAVRDRGGQGQALPAMSGPGLCRQWTHHRKRATAMNTARQAAENMAYVRRLLKEKQAGFSAAVELAVSLIDRRIGRPCRLAPAPDPSCPGSRGSAGAAPAIPDQRCRRRCHGRRSRRLEFRACTACRGLRLS